MLLLSVIDRDLNGAGRGLNIVVLDTQTNEVLRIAHFDTYAEGWTVVYGLNIYANYFSESNSLEIFLEQLQRREMIAVVSFDEAATK